jgi:hypothetical protein
MKCYNCSFYKVGHQWNYCGLTESECFRTQEDCKFVNDDGSVNNNELEKAFGG